MVTLKFAVMANIPKLHNRFSIQIIFISRYHIINSTLLVFPNNRAISIESSFKDPIFTSVKGISSDRI